MSLDFTDMIKIIMNLQKNKKHNKLTILTTNYNNKNKK